MSSASQLLFGNIQGIEKQFFVTPGSYEQIILADSPYNYWQLEETSLLDPVADSAGNNNGSYINSPELEQPALISDSTKSMLCNDLTDTRTGFFVDYDPNFFSEEFSAEFWFRFNQNDSDTFGGMFGCGAGNEGDSWFQFRRNTNEVEFVLKGSVQTPLFFVWEEEVTYHAVGLYDRTANEVRFYINGSLVDSASRTADIGRAALDITAGYDVNYNTRNFRGNLDELAIYHYALSEEQITAHYEAGVG